MTKVCTSIKYNLLLTKSQNTSEGRIYGSQEKIKRKSHSHSEIKPMLPIAYEAPRIEKGGPLW